MTRRSAVEVFDPASTRGTSTAAANCDSEEGRDHIEESELLPDFFVICMNSDTAFLEESEIS
jgi:hypothetical protein